MSTAVLAASGVHGGLDILCTILLVATVIAFILGLAEALGVFSTGIGGRFGALVVAAILLVLYVVLC